MTPQEEAKKIYNQVVKEGMSTDYCYSPDFYKWVKEMAKNRATSVFKDNFFLEEVILAIDEIILTALGGLSKTQN